MNKKNQDSSQEDKAVTSITDTTLIALTKFSLTDTWTNLK
jgi:hypothetical protein